MTVRRPKQNSERGVHLVELAFGIPILLMFVAAIAEFGSYFYTYTSLSKATRAGARYLSAKPYTNAEKDKTKNLMICGNLNGCGGQPSIVNGLSAANIQITTGGGTTFLPDTVTVGIVNYNYTSVFKMAALSGSSKPWTSVPVKAATTMRYLLEN